MREKQFRKKNLALAKETQATARQSAEEKLRGSASKSVKLTVRQAGLVEKGRNASNSREVKVGLDALNQATLFDDAQPAGERIEALQETYLSMSTNKEFKERLIRLIGNAKQPLELRTEALDCFIAATFGSRSSASWRPQFLETLRSVAQSSEDPLAEKALEVLAQERDPWALETLQAGLRTPAAAKVSQIQAIQHLNSVDHNDHYDVLRKLATKNRSHKVRVEAIRGLAADPNAKDLLLQILKGSKEPPAVRQAALLSLRIADRDAYGSEASRILNDASEPDLLRATSMATQRYDPDGVGEDYSSKVQQISEGSDSDTLRKAAQYYLPKKE